MIVIFCIAIGFLLGSMPFSAWLSRLAARQDIRRVGDGNPGAVNAWKAGGWRVGVTALLLDYLKGAAPVGLAHFGIGLSGWELVPVGLAPVLGHAFSPFLHFRGGKALAVTFGIWTGLTLGEGPIMLGLFFSLFVLAQTADAWAVMLGMLGLLAYLFLRQASLPILVIAVGNLLLLGLKHRRELQQQNIRIRPLILKTLGRNR